MYHIPMETLTVQEQDNNFSGAISRHELFQFGPRDIDQLRKDLALLARNLYVLFNRMPPSRTRGWRTWGAYRRPTRAAEPSTDTASSSDVLLDRSNEAAKSGEEGNTGDDGTAPIVHRHEGNPPGDSTGDDNEGPPLVKAKRKIDGHPRLTRAKRGRIRDIVSRPDGDQTDRETEANVDQSLPRSGPYYGWVLDRDEMIPDENETLYADRRKRYSSQTGRDSDGPIVGVVRWGIEPTTRKHVGFKGTSWLDTVLCCVFFIADNHLAKTVDELTDDTTNRPVVQTIGPYVPRARVNKKMSNVVDLDVPETRADTARRMVIYHLLREKEAPWFNAIQSALDGAHNGTSRRADARYVDITSVTNGLFGLLIPRSVGLTWTRMESCSNPTCQIKSYKNSAQNDTFEIHLEISRPVDDLTFPSENVSRYVRPLLCDRHTLQTTECRCGSERKVERVVTARRPIIIVTIKATVGALDGSCTELPSASDSSDSPLLPFDERGKWDVLRESIVVGNHKYDLIGLVVEEVRGDKGHYSSFMTFGDKVWHYDSYKHSRPYWKCVGKKPRLNGWSPTQLIYIHSEGV